MQSPPQSQNLDSPNIEVSHGIAQGMLVTLGNIYGYETFAPTHDQTTRDFQDKKLKDLVSLKNCDDIFRGANLSKIREIDVMWFSEDDYGLFPTYAFEVEHTTMVRSGLDRLLKIPNRYTVRLCVVAPGEEERDLFGRFVSQTPFRNHRDRFAFRLYSQLESMYNAAVRHETERQQFGISERCREI